MSEKFEIYSNAFANQRARFVTTACMLMSGAAFGAADSFTDKVGAAKAGVAGDAAGKVKAAVNSTVDIISMVVAAAGFLVFIWGIFWVMSASRSEGRKEAGPGWMMMIGGGVLGAAAGIYYLFVSGAASVTT